MLTYFRHACASASESNDPIVRKVCVTPTPGPITVGLFNATPKKSVVDPDPFAAGSISEDDTIAYATVSYAEPAEDLTDEATAALGREPHASATAAAAAGEREAHAPATAALSATIADLAGVFAPDLGHGARLDTRAVPVAR